MADDDKELFESALTDEQPAIEAAPAPEPQEEQPVNDGQPRDEHGRFAPKAKEEPNDEQPAPQEQPVQEGRPEPEKPKGDGIPPWRLREEAEARRAAEERARQYEQEMADLRRQFAQVQEQSKQPEKVPEFYEDPNAFVGHNVKSAIDPLNEQISEIKQFYSHRDAVRTHGEEKVRAAYEALESALRSRNPEAAMVRDRARQSIDPFGQIVEWHLKQSIYSQIGNDPNAWFEKQLEDRLKDPAHQAKLLERLRGNVQPNSQRPVTQLPPSLNKAASSAHIESGDDEDHSDAGLLKASLRR